MATTSRHGPVRSAAAGDFGEPVRRSIELTNRKAVPNRAIEASAWIKFGEFYRMADVVPEGAIGSAVVEHYDVSQEEARHRTNMAAFKPGGGYFGRLTPGRYCRLKVGGQLVMSDTDMERTTNLDAVRDSRGDVLIGGLGIGLIVLPMLAKGIVRSVTVVERNRDVIGLVEPSVREWARKHFSAQTGQNYSLKLAIEHGDVHEWEPEKAGRQFDYVYFDIWPTICSDDLAEHAVLRKRYARWVRKGGKVDSWVHDWLRQLRRMRG